MDTDNQWRLGFPIAQVQNPELEPVSIPPFCPTVQEVLAVKALILGLHKLPIEIIDMIVDLAEYWPRTTVEHKGQEIASGRIDADRGLNAVSNKFIIRSLPLGYSRIESNYALPLQQYLSATPIAREAAPPEVIQVSTSELLANWTAVSLPRTERPCRKITFTTKSRDQGWGGVRSNWGTYKASYTWFDAGLERVEAIDRSNCTPDTPFPEGFTEKFCLPGHEDSVGPFSCDIVTIDPPIMEDHFDPTKLAIAHPFGAPPTMLQSNVLAKRSIKTHIITWSYNDFIDPESAEGSVLEEKGRGRSSGTGDFVRQLRVGDIITVWARARFPGWSNFVEEVRIDVYWAV